MDRYIALDLETTGLSPKHDRIIEIGAVKVVNNQITELYSTFVNPNMAIPPRIQELTGITTEMTTEGANSEQAVEQLMEFCGDDPLLGHNIMFDFSFIKHKAVNMGRTFERNGMDTLMIARRVLHKLESRKLEALCRYYGIQCDQFHRASDDAMAAHLLYQKLREEYQPANPEMFVPKPLIRTVKKQGPLTQSQKVYLNDLVKYHRIELDVKIDSLTKNEASRLIDRIISEHGRITR